jgi:twitching motility protein PilT
VNPSGKSVDGEGGDRLSDRREFSMHLIDLLRLADAASASDLHLVAEHPPMLRVDTLIEPLDRPDLTAEDVEACFEVMTNDTQRAHFQQAGDLDFSYEVDGLGRYRVNAHNQRGTVALALRVVRSDVPELADLNLPDTIARLTRLPRGLVLVTGDTGSGKSTTLAAMIMAMNRRSRQHIITLEDPVEYRLDSDSCLIEQRELGADMPRSHRD